MKNIISFLKKFFFGSIRKKIFISFLSFYLVIIVILFTVIYYSSKTSFTTSSINNSRRELATITNNISSKIEHIFDYAISVSLNDYIIQTTGKYSTPPTDEIIRYNLNKNMNTIVNSIIGLNNSVAMWEILASDGIFFNTSGYNINSIQNLDIKTIINKHNNNKGPCISGPYLYESSDILATDDPEFVFIVSKPIIQLNSRKLCGYIIFFIKNSTISSLFENYMPAASDSSFYILNNNNDILLSSNKGMIYSSFLNNKKLQISDSDWDRLNKNGFIVNNIAYANSLDIVYSMTALNDIQWKIINAIPLKLLLNEQQVFNRTFFICFLCAFIAFFVLAYIFARSITKPILKLTQIMQNVSEDAYETTVIPNNSDEIGILYKGYNSLILQTQELLTTIYEEQEAKNDFKFKLVQAQINPHFLYNTLEMIKSMIDLNMNEESSEAITALSIFYRLSLSKGSDIITIENEIDIAQQYMYIEKLRHTEYFDYQIIHTDSINQCIIPKLTLQPILENAIIHGVVEKESKGTIILRTTETDNKIHFSIEDNGPGIDEKELKKLLSVIEDAPQPNLPSFGLSNINRRIKLLFGKEYGLSISSKLGQYTKVMLTIPKVFPLNDSPSLAPYKSHN